MNCILYDCVVKVFSQLIVKQFMKIEVHKMQIGKNMHCV